MGDDQKTPLQLERPTAFHAGLCSPAALQARASIGADLYREGRITRAECFRLAVDASIGQDSGPIEYEANDDHEFMMTGEGLDHDEYRRPEKFGLPNDSSAGTGDAGTPQASDRDA